jgi:hypothetical protein
MIDERGLQAEMASDDFLYIMCYQLVMIINDEKKRRENGWRCKEPIPVFQPPLQPIDNLPIIPGAFS